ncbi:MAG: DegT/DnrJ/EryC1/StrS aminotransferase family protein [Acidobacteriota bacterium]
MNKDLPACAGGVPTRATFLPIGRPDISEAEKAEVLDTLSGTWLSKGPKVQQFQQEFACYVGVHRALALNSCTAALHLALIAAGVGPGDEVIIPSLTFVATANVVCYVGAIPIFTDVEPDTLLMSMSNLKDLVGPKTKAIIPVHLYGRPCRSHEILEFARKHSLVVIEDAAHAVGTIDCGKHIGSIGHFTCFSFYATKNLCTGDGGMVTCRDNDEAMDRMEILSLHGMSTDAWKRFSPDGSPFWGMVEIGYKYNLTDLQASLGIHQLRRLEGFLGLRQKLVEHYRELLIGDPRIKLLAPDPVNGRHSHHLFAILLNTDRLRCNRDEFVSALKQENIGSGVHYHALHMQPYYRERFSLLEEDFPVATAAHRQLLTLPLHTGMQPADVEDTVVALKRLLNYFER